jgi:hypothetical protein
LDPYRYAQTRRVPRSVPIVQLSHRMNGEFVTDPDQSEVTLRNECSAFAVLRHAAPENWMYATRYGALCVVCLS